MPIKLRDTTCKVIFSVGLEVISRTLEKNDKFLEGLPGKIVELEYPKVSSQFDNQGAFTQIDIPDRFPGGSVILLETAVDSKVPTNIEALVKTIPDNVFGELGWMELNIVLYRCDGEEQDLTRKCNFLIIMPLFNLSSLLLLTVTPPYYYLPFY